MLAKNSNFEQLQQALDKINEKYEGNIRFKRLEYDHRNIRFTLTVNNSRAKGGRLGFPDWNTGKQKHIAAACWHVHGDFFDALFAIAPDADILANGNHITARYGNWVDRNIGSIMNPLYYSDACECEI